jgi:hypothetical protein
MVIVALERYTPPAQRLFDDGLAVRFLPLGGRLLVGACRWGLFWRFVYTLSLRLAQRQGRVV